MSSKHIIGCLISGSIATAYALAVGHNSRLFHGVPIIYPLVILIHLIQVLAFIPSNIFKTEKYYDATGSLAFIISILICVGTADGLTDKQLVAAGLVLVWTFRLGGFLFYRIVKTKHDSRFVQIKETSMRFFMAWFIQGLWVTITAGPVYVFLTEKFPTTDDNNTFGAVEIAGLVLWVLGFIIESVSDFQKLVFTFDPQNKDRFISTGLWKYSRHPNYCGEIMLWFGVTFFVGRSLEGWQLITLISPIFVHQLLTKLSGVPLLEAKGNKKWKNDQAYIQYKQNTPIMFPWSPKGDSYVRPKK